MLNKKVKTRFSQCTLIDHNDNVAKQNESLMTVKALKQS